ncbi:MAG: hypothetical protein ACKOVB_20710, partial [Terrabacter sp.]
MLGGPDGRTADELGVVALLMGLKTALDLLFHLGEHLVYSRGADGGGSSGCWRSCISNPYAVNNICMSSSRFPAVVDDVTVRLIA